MQTQIPIKRGRGRPRKIRPEDIGNIAAAVAVSVATDGHNPLVPLAEYIAKLSDDIADMLSPNIPCDWIKGQLLNVRIAGDGYRVTLLGEEYDPRNPDRCLEFSDGFRCQKFVSEWYSREHSDPRAF